MILLPIVGLALAFPFSNSDVNGFVNYRSTETLYFNEFWYEYEKIEVGNEITFSVQSSPSDITFAIWDLPFESLTTKTNEENLVNSTSLSNDEYWYEQLFLRPGSSIEYEFNASSPIDFFISDGSDLSSWDQGGNPSFYVNKENINQDRGILSIFSAQDYYIVWHNNDDASSVNIDYSINYIAIDVIDFSNTFKSQEGVDEIQQDTFSVPHSGKWYFFIYFNPMNSPDESTTITFDVSYDTGITANDRWFNIQWILIIVLIVIIVILLAGFMARKSQKELKLKAPTIPSTGTSPYKKSSIKTPEKLSKCVRCNATLKPNVKFCSKCGGKVEGRIIATPSLTTPAKSKTCSLCGSKLTEKEHFCKWCGTKVEDQ